MLPQPESPACCPAPNTPKQPMAARQPQGQGWAAPRPTEPAGAIRAGGTWEVSELFCLHFAQQLFCQAAQPRAGGTSCSPGAIKCPPACRTLPAVCVPHTRCHPHGTTAQLSFCCLLTYPLLGTDKEQLGFPSLIQANNSLPVALTRSHTSGTEMVGVRLKTRRGKRRPDKYSLFWFNFREVESHGH